MINYNQIYVAVRIKAYLNNQDKEESCIQSFTDKQIVISKSNMYEQQYEFNQIFDSQCDQEQIYLCVAYPIVKDALNGISSNLIIYGSQGSGKTYSLFGTIGSLFTLKQGLISIESGIAIRMIHQLHQQKQISELKIFIIDNEQIINHLMTNGQSKWIELAKQLCEVIQNLNDSIIHVVIEIKTLQNSKIKIIQIGSISKGYSGQMVTHNKSIFTLHRCIQCLIDQQKQKKIIQMQRIYIPFRESKLTNLLSNSFLGQAQLKIILCLAPTKIDDALGTLQFGQQFQQIKILKQQSKHQTQFSVQQQFQTQSQLQLNEFNSMTTQSQTLEMIPIQFHLQKIQELTDKYESIIQYLQQKIIKYKNR
ncbi:unnamed protein product [Paramecium primaurelia]|uniref:Kinesin motor domain-containing protein n=1 Tax=Paramecium primaurelia TaxID=5886 RepID=A0A8S1KZ15_PARPR|nr:unnamed protein product [Paramecium primaurelia]